MITALQPTVTTLRQRLEAILLAPPCQAITLDRLYSLLPDQTHQQVRDGLNYLRKLGRIVQHGSNVRPIYQGVLPTHPAPVSLAKPATPPDPSRRMVIWPAGLKIQVATPSALATRGTWAGPDWSHATQRPGCQDHLQYPSRRGDQRVMHQAQLSGCVGDLRDKRSNGR